MTSPHTIYPEAEAKERRLFLQEVRSVRRRLRKLSKARLFALHFAVSAKSVDELRKLHGFER